MKCPIPVMETCIPYMNQYVYNKQSDSKEMLLLNKKIFEMICANERPYSCNRNLQKETATIRIRPMFYLLKKLLAIHLKFTIVGN